MGTYKNAQVCTNGHTITEDTTWSELLSDYCSYCGQKTITECPHCNSKIRGRYCIPGSFSPIRYVPPAYCYHCGKPFPWTESRLAAANELVYDMDELSQEEQEKLSKCFPDIIAETPMTTVSANRVKKYLSKLPSQVGACLRDIFVDIASETAKKIIWPT